MFVFFLLLLLLLNVDVLQRGVKDVDAVELLEFGQVSD